MYRTHTCGEIRINHQGSAVTLAGWVQRVRNLGGMTFIDLRDRYGITQLVFDETTDQAVAALGKQLGREYVIQASGTVRERSSKNKNIPTGEVELAVSALTILNSSETPPFTIEDESDGGDEIRMKYRYLDLRRAPVRDTLILRSKMAHATRSYLNSQDFIETETPVLIKSTPEGARDFVVPSRMNPGEFYALPQSPDCEMSFVEQEDILNMFEGLTKYLFKEIKGITITEFPRMSYSEAMESYGSDKPDIRFGMKIKDLTSMVKGKGFSVFDDAEFIGGICAEGCSEYTRKQLDALTEWVKRPQVGAKGMVYLKYNTDGTIKSSVDKFYSAEELAQWVEVFGAKPGDLVLLLSGVKEKMLKAIGDMRLEMANQLGLRDKNVFQPLWVVDFPLLEWDEDTARFYAMHHPFTSPKPEDFPLLETNPKAVRANAYDLVINGVEIGGGSVRIHDKALQAKMFGLLGFTPEQAEYQFGFLMNAFKFGAPPHAGIAFGFDRLTSMFAGLESIRDTIAFPKNNSGRDVMMDSPSTISDVQLEELNLILKAKTQK